MQRYNPSLRFQDNEISTFKRGTFHSQANPSLAILDLRQEKFNIIISSY